MSGGPRLDKLLANLGYGSRREVQSWVKAGRVRLGGVALTTADCKLGPEEVAALTVDGEPLDPRPGLVLVMNKPAGLTCSAKDVGPLVYDLLPARWRRRDPPISTVGRLDKETSGLLLLTDDGALLHRIISPRTHLPKRYRANLARPVGEHVAACFADGTLMLEGEAKPLLPAALEIVTATEVLVTIVEGRYHQVRRMFAALGNHVVALRRESIGAFDLPGDLPDGGFRPLEPAEVSAVQREGNLHTRMP